MTRPITASMLYDMAHCPHRPWMDLFADARDRQQPSPFLELLWQRGVLHERSTMEALDTPFIDLSTLPRSEKEAATRAAIGARHPLIYGGRLTDADLVGEPDLLRLHGAAYFAGDIKSGAGLEGDEETGKPKKHYAVQLALYTDVLERLGYSDGQRQAFVWDKVGREVVYDLATPFGKRDPHSFWDIYQDLLAQVRRIASGEEKTLPAYAAPCKLCRWRSACLDTLRKDKDLTLVRELGRAKRDSMAPSFPNISVLADADVEILIQKGKTPFAGVGGDTLRKFQRRSRLLVNPESGAYLTQACLPPPAATEVFFDIEDDPFRDVCYLHGFLLRKNGGAEEYHGFFSEDPTLEGEREAFAKAWALVRSLPADHRIFYYSRHERTWWRNLQERNADVCSAEEVEAMFSSNRSTDLLTDVVMPFSEWPTNDVSIKTLAAHLGFKWRDEDPSGSASIEWYAKWCETRDVDVKARILAYNEDDCRATSVLLEGLRGLRIADP